jgi:hypothetical protein
MYPQPLGEGMLMSPAEIHIDTSHFEHLTRA